jgi:hypothetical protein
VGNCPHSCLSAGRDRVGPRALPPKSVVEKPLRPQLTKRPPRSTASPLPSLRAATFCGNSATMHRCPHAGTGTDSGLANLVAPIPHDSRCSRRIGGAKKKEAPVGVEPTMADLQSGVGGGFARGWQHFLGSDHHSDHYRSSRPCPRCCGRGMVEPPCCGPGRHPRDGAGEPLSRGGAPGHCCGPPVPAGRRNCGRFVPDPCRFVIFSPPAACKRGVGEILSQNAWN